MKGLISRSVLSLLSLLSFSSLAETLDLGRIGWQGQRVGATLAAPDAAKWSRAATNGWRSVPGKTTPRSTFERVWEPGGTWKRTTFDAPVAWKDAFVRLDLGPLALVDAVVFVNGEKAGEILRPGGSLDVSRFVKPGAANELRIYYTLSGEGTSHGTWNIGQWWQHFKAPGPLAAPRLVASAGPQVTDVFANTSVQKRRIDFEIEVTCRDDARKTSAPLAVVVRDADGKVVKRLAKTVALKGGVNTFSLGEAWKDPCFWELGAPYLYTAEATVGDAAAKTIRFGFREIWRDGKALMMNGHKVRLRTCFDYATNANGIDFLRDIGYNVITANHSMDTIGYVLKDAHLDDLDERGVGYFCSPGDCVNIAGYDFATDPAAADQLRRFYRYAQRGLRNHPSVLACYVTQMIICNIGWSPKGIGQGEGKSARDVLINKARDISREANPNILYYSHADGPNGDLSSGNIYLNWTPLQEREEWFSQWKEKGTYPWHGAEVGQPYIGSWFDRGLMYVGTEHLAQYFGDAVYAAEEEEWLRKTLDAGRTMPSCHSSDIGSLALHHHPHFKELERLFVWRSNSRWRADGQNGGNLWFNREGYGSEKTGAYNASWQYSLKLTKPTNGKRPAWASSAYDAYQLGNQDFCGYIGGSPAHYDKTHAYCAGETIAKQAVFCWDGLGAGAFTAEATFNGETKTVTADVATGETAFRPFSFTAPDVARKTAFDLTLTFRQGAKTWFTDTLKVEVYPREGTSPHTATRGMHAAMRIALFDPKGASEGVLKAIGVPYRKIASLDELGDAEALVVGRFAAKELPLDVLAAKVAAGFRVLILAQDAATWQAFGLKPMDAGSRQLWLRDKNNPLFAEVTDDTLAYWRGAPDYGDAGYGPLMSHAKQRGPRGWRNHLVAGMVLEIPSAVGYRSVIDGEFDMNYAGVLEFLAGAGKVTYCTLDLEGRAGVDPAATVVARAVVANALAAREDTRPPATLCVSADSKLTWSEIKARAGAGARVLVEANARLASEAGLNVGETTKVWRATLPADDAAFRCIGPSLTRWSDYVETRLVDGQLAKTLRVGKGEVVFLTVPRGQLAARYGETQKKERRIALYAEEHVDRLYGRVMTNLGFAPGEKAVRRALYQQGVAAYKPLPAVYALGPFATGKDDDDTINKVWCAEGEKMAIAGDFNPNFDFALPQGGTCNWRTTVVPDANGCYDFRAVGESWQKAKSPCVYAIAVVKREAAGEALLKLGMDWRLRVWVNGEEVWKSTRGAHFPKFEVKVSLKKGENVIAFKLGAGSAGCRLHALLESEGACGSKRASDPALDAMSLYPDRIVFDPYEFTFW